MKATWNLASGFVSCNARHEGMHQPVHFRDGIAAHHADIALLRHGAGDHAGEIGGILDVVVEHREIGIGRGIGLEARADEEGAVGIVLGDGARRILDREGFADDELVARLAIFAHHPLIVGIGDLLGECIFDVAALLGGERRLVDAAHPLLLDRHRIDGGGLDHIRGQARPAPSSGRAAAEPAYLMSFRRDRRIVPSTVMVFTS